MAVAEESRGAARLYGNAYLLLALASLFWSGNHIMGRAIAGHVPPIAIGTLRWLLAAALLWPFVRHRVARDWPLIRPRLPAIIYLSLLGGALFGTLQFVGLQYTTALNTSVMNSLAPVLIVAASAVMFRDRLTARQGVGIAISLLGVVVIISRLDPAVISGLAFNLGDVIILVNMGLWGIYSASLRLRPPIDGLSFMFLFALISGIAMLPLFCWEITTAANVNSVGRLRHALLHDRRIRVLDARRRADRAEPGRRVPASRADLQRAVDRNPARRAVAHLSRDRLRADFARRMVRGAAVEPTQPR